MTVVLVGVAAAVGTVVRVVMISRLDRALPVGTLTVNVVGSFALARLVASESEALTIVGTGALGALTTWSAVAVGALAAGGRMVSRLAIGGVAIGAPLAAAWVGIVL